MEKYEEIVTEKQVRLRTGAAFFFFLLFIAAVLLGWKWLQQQPKEQGTLKPLRAVLNANEAAFENIFSYDHLARTYPQKLVVPRVRVNGKIGLSPGFDTSSWKLKLAMAPGDTQFINIEALKALPKTEIIFDFKCIEGWSQVTRWAGVKFSDLANKYGMDKLSLLNYTGLSTPDGKYYVGIDTRSMMHPQTILCYEMNGAPLPLDHGAPLRLIIPVKYGIKHLKRIGTIYFSKERPPDYWYERGYDYYSGL